MIEIFTVTWLFLTYTNEFVIGLSVFAVMAISAGGGYTPGLDT